MVRTYKLKGGRTQHTSRRRILKGGGFFKKLREGWGIPTSLPSIPTSLPKIPSTPVDVTSKMKKTVDTTVARNKGAFGKAAIKNPIVQKAAVKVANMGGSWLTCNEFECKEGCLSGGSCCGNNSTCTQRAKQAGLKRPTTQRKCDVEAIKYLSKKCGCKSDMTPNAANTSGVPDGYVTSGCQAQTATIGAPTSRIMALSAENFTTQPLSDVGTLAGSGPVTGVEPVGAGSSMVGGRRKRSRRVRKRSKKKKSTRYRRRRRRRSRRRR